MIVKASSVEEAYELLNEHASHTVLGGGVWLKRLPRKIEKAITLDALNLDYIKAEAELVKIGSMTPLQSLVDSDLVQSLGSEILSKAINHVMGVGLRNLATLGGSVVGRYGFSDIIPPLLALDAKLVFHRKGEITLEKFLETKGSVKDILIEVIVPRKKSVGYFKKVSNTPLDFSILNITIVKKEDSYCIILGSRPGGAVFARKAMAFLGNKPLNTQNINEAVRLMEAEISFGTNHSATADYRHVLAKTYVRRGLEEVGNYES